MANSTQKPPAGSTHHAEDDAVLIASRKAASAETSRSERNFPIRLWDLLSSLEEDGLDHIVSWAPHGRCFIVKNQDEFVRSILPA